MQETAQVQEPVVLAIAASDSGAGAGIQADIKTCMALGTYAVTAITAITAQNTLGVQHLYPLPAETVTQQLQSLVADMAIVITKISVLPSPDVAQAVAQYIRQYAGLVIMDPVLKSSSGRVFVGESTLNVIKHELLPHVDLLTPNWPEAELLLGRTIKSDWLQACVELTALGPRQVLLKGGHAAGILHCQDGFFDGTQGHLISGRPVASCNTHGTGCTLSAAIAAYKAQGQSWLQAIMAAKQYCQRAIELGAELRIGQGCGPLQHRVKRG